MEVHGYTETGSIEATIEGVRLTVPDDMANRHRQMIAEWEAAGNTIPAFNSSPAPVAPVTLQQIAGARLVADQGNWEVTGIERSFGISGAFLVDTDLVYIFFTQPQSDTFYEVFPSDGVTKHTDFVEVSRPGLTELNFIVQRVQ